MIKTNEKLKKILNKNAVFFEKKDFIKDDPISIPHKFTKKQDIEISAFLISIIAWGNRKSIIKNGTKMMELMSNSPYDFIINHKEKDLKPFFNFVHRTFNGEDLVYFIIALKNIYSNNISLESVFNKSCNIKESIILFRNTFFSLEHLKRTEKHIANPMKKSAAKRINMFLRWMVRSSKNGVDFGIWKSISPSNLMLPLDVHTARISRKLNLLTRKSNDWIAVEEVTNNLKKIDPADPIKYDFALFGMGITSKS